MSIVSTSPEIGLALLVLLVFSADAHPSVLHVLHSPHEQLYGHFGASVSSAGDVDGDGIDDIIVGAPWETIDTLMAAGRAYVYSGASGNVLFICESPNVEENGRFGSSVSDFCDINDDGKAEFLIGAFLETSTTDSAAAGRVYVMDGQTGTTFGRLESPNADANGYFGWTLSGSGDINGDGVNDIIVGAFREDTGGMIDAGRAYVFEGDTHTIIHSLTSVVAEEHGHFGYSVSNAGDVNIDEFDDVIVGAYRENPGSSPLNAGRAYVYSGATGAVLHTLTSPYEVDGGFFGQAVAGAGDVNGDNHDDLLVGAPWETIAGRAYVFDGVSGDTIVTLEPPTDTDRISGDVDETFDLFGIAVSRAGDMGGDGNEDVLIGAPWSEDQSSSPGKAYVIDGISGSVILEISSPAAQYGCLFGEAVAISGDMSGDGYEDIIVGSHLEDSGLFPDAGAVYIYSLAMQLAGVVSEGTLILSWDQVVSAHEYWVYGGADEPFFSPQLTPPFSYRVAITADTTWASSAGLGDPEINWFYQIIALDESNNGLIRSNRAGEFEFLGP